MQKYANTPIDDLIIGSSPLMMLVANELANNNNKTFLIERNKNLGGAWQSATTGSNLEVEIACHLIEVFPGVYEYLQEVTKTPFIELELQPIRLHRKGHRLPYFSRIMLLASGLRLLLGWFNAEIDELVSRTSDRNTLLNFRAKLKSYVKFQLPTFVQMQPVCGPEDGYVCFLSNLVAACKRSGVQFINNDVERLERKQDGWLTRFSDGKTIHAKRVHITTATNLVQASKDCFEAAPLNFNLRVAVVVEINAEDIQLLHSYIAFWKDTTITRISRIDNSESCDKKHYQFLVELKDDFQGEFLTSILKEKLQLAQIINSEAQFTIAGKVYCEYVSNTEQLPAGEIEKNLYGYNSTGNLAAGIISWMRKPPYNWSESNVRNEVKSG